MALEPDQQSIYDQCPIPNGTLLLIGGHESKGNEPESLVQKENSHPLEILKTFITLTGKKQPVIEVITSASGVADESFQDYKKAFNELGVTNVGQIHHTSREQILNDDLTERIIAADAIFLTGGSQLKLTSIYGGTEFLCLLKERYIYNHLVIAGTSAGAMAMSTPMILSGNKEKQQLVGKVNIGIGLEFVKDVSIDTHFVERERFLRLSQVLALNPVTIGIGIEEDTAIIITHGTKVKVAGSGVIIIIEGYDISQTNIDQYETSTTISVRNLKVHILSADDEYEIRQLNPPHR